MSATGASAIAEDKTPTIPIPIPVACTTLSTAAVGVPQSSNAAAAIRGANNRQQIEHDSVASQRMSSFADRSQEE